MGTKVNASQAAQLVNRTERRVRQWITDGKLRAEPSGPRAKVKQSADPRAPKVKPVGPTAWSIDVDDLALVPGVTVDASRLAEITAASNRTPTGMLARIEQLERELRGVKARLSLLEGVLRGSDAPESAVASSYASDVLGQPSAANERPTATYTPTYAPPASPPKVSYISQGIGQFRTRADAGRFLERHGINSHTARTWRGWEDVALEPTAILRDALARQATTDWRVRWRVTRCSDPTCVCRDLISE